MKGGVGPGQANRVADVRAVANGLTLAGYKTSLTKSTNPDETDSRGAEQLRSFTTAFQKAHGEKPDSTINPDGPTQDLLSFIAAPEIAHLSGPDPKKRKPWKAPERKLVGRTLKSRPTTIRTFEQDRQTMETRAEHEAAVELSQFSGSDKNENQHASRAAVDRELEYLPKSTNTALVLGRPEAALAGRGNEPQLKSYDPATPIADYIHRRQKGEPYSVEDALVILALTGATQQGCPERCHQALRPDRRKDLFQRRGRIERPGLCR